MPAARRYELVCDGQSEETMRQRLLRQKIRNVSLYPKSPGMDKPPASFSELTVVKSPRGPTYEVQYVKTKKEGISQVPVVRIQPKKPSEKEIKQTKSESDKSDIDETGSIISEKSGDVKTGDMVGLRVIACNKKDGLYYPGTVASHLESTYALVNFNFNKRQRVRTHMIIPMSGAIARPELAPGDFVLVKVFKQEVNLDCYVPALVEFVPNDFRPPTKFYSVLLYNGQRASTMRKFIVKIGRSRFEVAVNYIAHIQTVERQKSALPDDTPRSQDTQATRSTNHRSDRSEDGLSDHSSVRSSDRSSVRSGSERGRKKKEKITKKLVQKQKEQKQKQPRSESKSKKHSRSSSRSNSRSRSRSRSRSDSETTYSRTSENTQQSSKEGKRRQSKRRPKSRSTSRSRSRSISDSERTISRSSDRSKTPSRKGGGRPPSRRRSRRRSYSRSRSTSRSVSRSRTRSEAKSKKHSRSNSMSKSRSRSRSRSNSRSTSRSRSWSDSERTSENTLQSSKGGKRRHSKRRPKSRSSSRSRSLSDSERTISRSLDIANTPSRKGGRPPSRQRSYSRSRSTTRPRSRSRTRSKSHSSRSRSRSRSRSGSMGSWSKSESENTTPRRRTRSRSGSSTAKSRSRSHSKDSDRTPRASPVARPTNPVPQPRPSMSEQSPRQQAATSRPGIYVERSRRSQSPNSSAAVQFDEKDQVIGDLQYQLNKQLRKQMRQERRLIRQARTLNKIQRKLNHSDQNDSVASDKTDRSRRLVCSSNPDGSSHRRNESPDGTSLRHSPDLVRMPKSVSGLEFDKEVLARWSDDGWYYRGRVLKTQESNFILMDTNGHLEEISREDILTDDGHKFDVIQPQDCVIALHPKYVFSYAPGEVLHVFDNGEVKVEFYDGTLSKVTLGEVYGIPREKFKKDVEFIVGKEKELIGKSVVAREDRTGTYRLGVVDSRVGLAQQYYIKWLDGDMCKQTSTHVFEVSLRRIHSESLEHVLAPIDDRCSNYKPAIVLQREPLNLQFCDGYSNSEARKEQCFWISKEYYSNAVEYLLSRQEGRRS